MPASLPLLDTTAPLCCAPLGSRAFEPGAAAEQVAARLRAMADANRVRILQELTCCAGNEITTSDAATHLGVSAATANHHLQHLERAGLVRARRDGARVFYGLQADAVRAVARAITIERADDTC